MSDESPYAFAHDDDGTEAGYFSLNGLATDATAAPVDPAQDNEEDVMVQKQADASLGLCTEKQTDGSLMVLRVLCDGPCHRRLHRGDRLLSVDGVSLAGLSDAQIAEKLKGPSQLTIRIRRSATNGHVGASDRRQFVLALFDYDAKADHLHPCHEAGLSFKWGDVIELVDDISSTDWPQGCTVARDSTERTSAVGIFPSAEFQRANRPETNRSVRPECYQPRSLMWPQETQPRPIVLVGPPGWIQFDLMQRLLQQHPDRFASPVVDTTRPRREEETDGEVFRFITEHEFESLQRGKEFLEVTDSRLHKYGVKFSSVLDVACRGQVCVLVVRPDCLEALRAHRPRLKPFTVFLRPATLDGARQLRRSSDTLGHVPLQDRQLNHMIKLGRRMSADFGHLFDHVLEQVDLKEATEALEAQSDWLLTHQQWVPSEWLDG